MILVGVLVFDVQVPIFAGGALWGFARGVL